jgi:phosphate transport system protein
MIEGHIARAFDGALSSLHVRIAEMGGLVLSQVHGAVLAYSEWNAEAANLVLERETLVNEYDLAIDEEALKIIARRQPMASDLRTIMAVEKAVVELERIGDESKKIARLVLVQSELRGFRPGPATAVDMRQLGRLAQNLLRAALQAFDQLDADAAELVVLQDKELDAEYANGLRRLLTRAMEDPRRLQAAVESAFVLKSLERIGDHARNLAQHVLFLVRGQSDRTREVRVLADQRTDQGADHSEGR